MFNHVYRNSIINVFSSFFNIFISLRKNGQILDSSSGGQKPEKTVIDANKPNI
jgi:hypothetical protein